MWRVFRVVCECLGRFHAWKLKNDTECWIFALTFESFMGCGSSSSKTEAAKQLGISRATLYRRIKAYGLNPDG